MVLQLTEMTSAFQGSAGYELAQAWGLTEDEKQVLLSHFSLFYHHCPSSLCSTLYIHVACGLVSVL